MTLLALASLASLAWAGDDPDTWDLSHIFPTVEDWEAALPVAEKAIEAVAACEGTLAQGAEQLARCADTWSDAQHQLSLLHTYAAQHSDADTRDAEWQNRRARVGNLWTRLGAAGAWVEPELQALPAEVDTWLQGEALATHRYPIQATRRRAEHTLSVEGERLMALTSAPRRLPFQTYRTLTAAEVPWPMITVDGEEIRLQPSAFTQLRSHPDRAVRREVFDTFFGIYADYQGTVGSLLNTTVQGHWGVAQARGFDSSVEKALFDDFLPREIYDTLVAETRAARPTLHRYFALRGRMLAIDDLGYHDLYVPLVDSDMVFDLKTSKELTWKSAKPLGKPYVKALREGLDGRWMDVYPREGKVPGAYMTGGAYGVHPYVLLNHNDDWSSATTLAHEMGHAMHTWLAQGAQPYATADYATFIAEIASTFNENLLLDYMLDRAKTDEERLYYLGSRLETLRGTYFRQAMFAEYELMIHEAHEKGEPLTGATLTAAYGELLRDVHGHDEGVVTIADADTLEWAYVPHFHYDFYVFQYATSLAASSLLSQRVLDGEKGAVERYLTLLESGGNGDAHELLKTAGVDLSTPAPYRAIEQQMNDIMDEMERILDARER